MENKRHKNWLAYTICSVGGIGYFPVAPGSFASLIAVILYFLINPQRNILFIGIIIPLILGLLLVGQLEKISGKDPGFIVIDEVAGQWITFLFLPANNIYILIFGFILFRFFDIRKPLGINNLQKLRSGWGVMLDDVLAGVYANIILQTLVQTGIPG